MIKLKGGEDQTKLVLGRGFIQRRLAYISRGWRRYLEIVREPMTEEERRDTSCF